MSSYRAELFGLYAALVIVWTIRHWLPRRTVRSVMDNLGAVLAHAKLDERLPTTSQDVWDEIFWYEQRIRGYFRFELRWQRGHPERHKLPSQFTFFESLQHLSDGLADVGRRGHGGVDPSFRFQHGRRWFVCYDDRRVFGQTAAVLLHQLGLAQLRGYRDFAPTSALDAWIRRAFCGTSKDVFSRAMSAKFVLGQLATQERAARWKYQVADRKCRLCCVDDTHENLRHLLLDCSFPKLCDIRRKYIASMVASRYLDSNDAFSTFLRDHFQLCHDSGSLRCLFGSGAADADVASELAFGFVRGFWPPHLVSAFQALAPAGVDSSEWFGLLVHSFARSARSRLWRPVWDVWHSAAVPSTSSASE